MRLRPKPPFEASVRLAMNSFYGFPKPKIPNQKVIYKAYHKLITDTKEAQNEP